MNLLLSKPNPNQFLISPDSRGTTLIDFGDRNCVHKIEYLNKCRSADDRGSTILGIKQR